MKLVKLANVIKKMRKNINFEELKGETLTHISGDLVGSEQIFFSTESGRLFVMEHDQDCCESVTVDDICGNLEDLIGDPILLAEEISNSECHEDDNYDNDSFTWTFYKLSTIKADVTIKWFGESNGYYSEEVTFREILPN